jgi:hypothetical protein
MKSIKLPWLPRKTILVLTLLGAMLASVAAQAYWPRYVWVTLYYDSNGELVGASSWGDCSLGSWGQQSGSSTTQIYDCDGELPF